MRVITRHALTALLIACASTPFLNAQGGNTAEIQQKLTSEFALTKTTDDRSDIVTAGAVLLLHRDGLLMYSTPTATPPMNTYKDGRLQQSMAGNYFRGLGGVLKHGGDTSTLNSIPQRKFVSGEKFWITGITIQQDGVVLNVYSDPFNDVRYYAQIKFPFPKNSPPPTDAMIKTVEEVITVAPQDDANNGGDKDPGPQQKGGGGGAAPAAPAAPAAALAPIAPPPPPPDQPAAPPKTISVGQTRDVVVANWGQPSKDIKLGTKEILVYPDMKVTFVGGKVSDVQ